MPGTDWTHLDWTMFLLSGSIRVFITMSRSVVPLFWICVSGGVVEGNGGLSREKESERVT